jgi:hypothetical protein
MRLKQRSYLTTKARRTRSSGFSSLTFVSFVIFVVKILLALYPFQSIVLQP